MEKSYIPEIVAVRQDIGCVDRSKNCNNKTINVDILSVYTKCGPLYRLNNITYRIAPPIAILLPAGSIDQDIQVGQVDGIYTMFKGGGLVRRKPGSTGEAMIALGKTWLTVPILKEISATAADRLANLLHLLSTGNGIGLANRLRQAALLYQALAEYADQAHSRAKDTIHREAVRLRDMIETRAFENINLKTIYAQLEISGAYAETLFHKAFGITPTDYRLQLRLRQAKKLLATTTANVSQTAFAVGFHDALYFSKIFHKTFGTTPSRLILDFNATRKKI